MPDPKPFQAIAAMSRNRVIGRGNQIPWHLPEDFRWFKQTTTGHVLVMGRKTFESIGRPLPHRETIVLSRSPLHWHGVRVVNHLDQVQQPNDPRTYFICGGAEIYRLALPRCSDLFLTLVHREVEGDAFFPPFEDDFILSATLREADDFSILHYVRKPATERVLASQGAAALRSGRLS